MTKGNCAVPSCANPVRTRVWCSAHYSRWLRYGDPLALSYAKGRTPLQRFWQRVDQSSGEDGCWIWTGGKLTRGYGSFRINNKSWAAHRWLWIQNNGPIPEGLLVRHRCDNPPCVNPAHHELGTPAENSYDAVVRNRSTRGVRNQAAVLTDDLVVEIRRCYASGDVTMKSLAVTYGVTQGAICHIVTRKTWRHLLSEEERALPYRPLH